MAGRGGVLLSLGCVKTKAAAATCTSTTTMTFSLDQLCLNDVDPADDTAQIANLAVSAVVLCVFNLATLIVFIRAWQLHRKWAKAGGKSWHMQRHMILLFIAALTLSLPATLAWYVLFLQQTREHHNAKPKSFLFPTPHAGSCRCMFGLKQSGSPRTARCTTPTWSSITPCSSSAWPCFVLFALPSFSSRNV